MNFFKKIISSIENSETPISFFVLTFLFAINLRNFIEAFSTKNYSYYDNFETIIHFNLFYTSLAISLIILFYLLTKKKIISVSRIILSSFLIVVLPPIIDLTVSRGKGIGMSYINPGCHSNLLERFFSFFRRFWYLPLWRDTGYENRNSDCSSC
ncbi:hypothetical protein C0584_02705 [Candidatus Parcubacteria bacterium]|nr:MAG: hypothetical protein C0584_02705 [Candidatus Parcubacteria bacterium]